MFGFGKKKQQHKPGDRYSVDIFGDEHIITVNAVDEHQGRTIISIRLDTVGERHGRIFNDVMVKQ